MRKWALLVLVSVLAAAMVSPHAQAGQRRGGGGPQPYVTIGEFSLPPVIGPHMVLQRDLPAPIWGKAAAGTKVTVKFRGQSKSTTADAEGKWMVKLDPLKAGGPDVLTITGKDTITLDDVLVGEVWVGSGQSNMDTEVVDFNKYTQKDPVLADYAGKTHPKLRLLVTTGEPGWKEATPENTGKFSALLFSFGVPLQKELDVPVGLIEGALSCSPSGPWVTQEMLDADPDSKARQTAQKEGKSLVPEALCTTGGKHASCQIGSLYDNRIKPVVPYAIRGVVWDQGECGTAVQGVDQGTLMCALINGWRREWGQDFSFIYVQKPSGPGCAWDYENPVTKPAQKFAALPKTVPGTGAGLGAENRRLTMRNPNTAMAISSDLGTGLHPMNKSGYGARCAQVALGLAYGKEIEYYGPMYRSHQVEGARIRIHFDHVGQGLAVRHADRLQGFAIAGDDKVFHWADAVIDGDAVLVASAQVKNPVAVRYGWSKTYAWANLFNKDHMPAIPFRTDDWADYDKIETDWR